MNYFFRYPLLRPRLGALLLTLLTLTGAFAQNFVQKTGTDNPFNDLIAGLGTGINAGPALADFDNDGDLDLVAGHFNNRLRYFKNTGTATAAVYTELTGTDNPFNGVNPDNGFPYPAAGDLNGDGKTDLVLGTQLGNFLYLLNTGTATAPAFTIQPSGSNPFEGIDVGTIGHPALADMDGDGLLDFFGSDDNQTSNQYYKNTGTASAPAFTLKTGTDNPFNNLTGIRQAVLGDLNGDGDVDLLAVGFNALLVVPNLGTPTAASLTANGSFFIVQNFGASLRGTLGDVNGDGRLDIVLGHFTGGFYYFEQVPPPTTITQQPTPASSSVCQGGSASSTVAATGEDLAYQWYRNQPDEDEPVAGQNTATLSLTNLQPAASGNYYCRVSGDGGVKWSQAFGLTVNAIPTATLTGTTTVCQNAPNPDLTFTGLTGTAPFTFTYTVNGGQPQTAATTTGSSVTVSQPTTAPGTFAYALTQVSAGGCSEAVTGQSATVTVNAQPTATLVGSTTVCQNAPPPSLTFSGSGGTGPYTFTYSVNGGDPQTVATTSGNSVTLTQPTAAPGTFTYALLSVQDANCAATVTGQSAAVTVTTATAIQSLTPSQGACPGVPFTLAVEAVGQNLTYQWYRQSTPGVQPVAGATGPSLTLPAPVAGSYYVVVSGSCGAPVTSSTVTLSPLPPTTLRLTSLVSQTCQGGSLTLAVSGSGPAPLAYAWRKDDPSGPVLGTGTSFTLTNAQPADAGTYFATLTSTCTSQTVSVPVTVRYVRITTQPQSVNLCSGSTVLSVGVEAVGVTPTYQWRRNGTALLGATASTLSVASSRPGTYTVEVKSSCGNLLSDPATVGCGNGRLSAEVPTLSVAPNPVVGQEIRCRVAGLDNPAFGLTTATGQSVSFSVKTEGDGVFRLTPKATLGAGVYVLQATEGVRCLTQRVLVAD